VLLTSPKNTCACAAFVLAAGLANALADPVASHWSFKVPVKPALPEPTGDHSWQQNAIDAFVLSRLESAGLRPSSQATGHALIRRLSLDLTGLPPTPADVDRFLEDPQPNRFEALVDRLLASPAFGEKWAVKWLDLARYADTNGYEADHHRDMWAFRDWVIRALNADMPYHQFTIDQLAGDLLPDPSSDQHIATAFHRNTMTNVEGGTDDEEFRTAAVVDRVNTTMQVWMGITAACAACHTHKYDPLTIDEYYQVFAIFNQTEDHDHSDNRPVLRTPTVQQQRKVEELQSRIDSEANEDKRKQLQSELSRLEEQFPKTPVMRELPVEKGRATRIHKRGNFRDKGAIVTPGVPAAFHPLPVAKESTPNRLGLAHWIVDRQNPLTARVAVNRIWEELFGTGLVATSEDFGTQGDPPSHPGLLDYLAWQFMESGWSQKQLIKLIVMSATYRQSSRASSDPQKEDPRNRLLSRGPRFRLSAEAIRDQALAVSGLLSRKIGGPSVMPP
jgi:hypothetical protein